jgi:acetyl esterase/lipase
MQQLDRRRFLLAGLAIPVAAWSGALSSHAGSMVHASEDPLWFVDPELRPLARDILAKSQSLPALTPATLPALRSAPPPWVHAPRPDVPFVKKVIPGNPNAPDVTIYVINAKADSRRAGILHTHGGGFVLGSAADSIFDLQGLATELDCAIVTVDYRLAPETTYAGSIEDNYAGLRWLQAHALELGVDPTRIAVMGESAGGGHAALLAITARDRGEVPLAFQCLIYPMLDDRTGSTRKVPVPIGTLLWTADANRFGWRSFLGQEPGGASVPAKAVPARLQDFKGLPPTFVGVGSIDLFVQEDIAYAHRLIDAAVPTQLVVMPGAFHGFDQIGAGTLIGKSFNAMKLDALRRVTGVHHQERNL